MRIMFVTSRPLEINTSSSIRNRATIKGFLDLGHHVHVITTALNKEHSSYEESWFDKSLNGGNFRVTYLMESGSSTPHVIKKILSKFPRLKNVIYNIFTKIEIYDNQKNWVRYINHPVFDKIEEKYDVIVSSSDPKSSHLFVVNLLRYKSVKKIPWIQIWGDPFLIDVTNRSLLSKIKIKNAEIELLGEADKIIYVSQSTLEKQKEIYPEFSEKMNKVAIPYLDEINYPNNSLDNESLTFLYSGDYSSKIRNIIPLYNSINESRHKLIICGLGDSKLKETDRIKIYPRLSYEQVKQLEKEADVLVHLSNKSGTQIPGKIYQQSGTNKMILFILDGDKDMLLRNFERYGRYIFTENRKNEILKSMNGIIHGVYESTKFIIPDFNPTVIAKEILKN